MPRAYVYAIVRAARDEELALAGVDGLHLVRVVARGGVGCVVSDYEDDDPAALPREETVRRLLAHQRVVERVMQRTTVLPVRFGTVLGDHAEVEAVLQQGAHRLERALEAIEGKVEIEVAATWELARALERVSGDEAVLALKASWSTGRQPTFEQRVQLGRVVKECLDRMRDSYRARMIEVLRPSVLDAVSNVLVTDDLVMNVAFLVERDRQEEFDARVHQLDALFDHEITFRVIGPLPPYSFCTVELQRLSHDEIRAAARTLRLDAPSSAGAVRRAYRRLAATEQRKLHHLGVDPQAIQVQLHRLRRASEVLLRACGVEAGLASEGASAEPPRHAPAPLFVVSLAGTRGEEVEPSRYGGATVVPKAG